MPSSLIEMKAFFMLIPYAYTSIDNYLKKIKAF